MRRALQVAGLVTMVTAAGLATTGAASATTVTESASAPPPPANCAPNMRSKAIPGNWISRSPAENDRRITWEQVRDFDQDRNNHLNDEELRRFHEADIEPAGGAKCERPENPARR
jgi:hypothetical protein